MATPETETYALRLNLSTEGWQFVKKGSDYPYVAYRRRSFHWRPYRASNPGISGNCVDVGSVRDKRVAGISCIATCTCRLSRWRACSGTTLLRNRPLEEAKQHPPSDIRCHRSHRFETF